MNIGFAPCGLTSREAINKLMALGGINKSDLSLTNTITGLYWYIDTSDGYIYCHESHLDVKLNPNDIPEKINRITDLPAKMRELIILRQIDAGNSPNLSKFDEDPRVGAIRGGFEWTETPEKADFWVRFLYHKKYYLYYTLNVKKDETKLQDKTTSIGRSKDIAGSGICCKRCKPTIAGGHLRDRKAIKF